ncbi:MAG: cobalamin biosynthesis protein, partial [Spirochaetota bacterium]
MLVTLCAAFLLDLLLGDPAFALHPVRLIGGLLTGLRRLLYPLRRRLLAGALLTATAAGAVFVLARLAVGAG